VILGLLVEDHGLLDQLRIELRGDRAALPQGTVDICLDRTGGHDGDVTAKIVFPEPDHTGRFPGSSATDQAETTAAIRGKINTCQLSEGDAEGSGIYLFYLHTYNSQTL